MSALRLLNSILEHAPMTVLQHIMNDPEQVSSNNNEFAIALTDMIGSFTAQTTERRAYIRRNVGHVVDLYNIHENKSLKQNKAREILLEGVLELQGADEADDDEMFGFGGDSELDRQLARLFKTVDAEVRSMGFGATTRVLRVLQQLTCLKEPQYTRPCTMFQDWVVAQPAADPAVTMDLTLSVESVASQLSQDLRHATPFDMEVLQKCLDGLRFMSFGQHEVVRETLLRTSLFECVNRGKIFS